MSCVVTWMEKWTLPISYYDTHSNGDIICGRSMIWIISQVPCCKTWPIYYECRDLYRGFVDDADDQLATDFGCFSNGSLAWSSWWSSHQNRKNSLRHNKKFRIAQWPSRRNLRRSHSCQNFSTMKLPIKSFLKKGRKWPSVFCWLESPIYFSDHYAFDELH